MKTRNEIDNKYKWDLACYVKDEQELENNLNYLKQNMHTFKKFYGKLGDIEVLKEFLKFDYEYDNISSRTGCYIYNVLNTDTSNTKYLNYMQQLQYIGKECGEITAFVYPQMLELSDEYLNTLIADEQLKDYRRYFEGVLRDKPHKVSEYDAQFLSKMSLCLGNDSEVFDTLTSGEMKFDDAVDSNGNKFQVTEAEYPTLIDNPDRPLRKSAFSSLMGGYGGKIRTMAQLYTNDIQYDIFYTKLTNFQSVKQSCMFNEEVDEQVYNNLIKNINSRLDVLQNIVALKGKHLGLDDVAYYDMMTTIGVKKNYSVEQAVEMVKQSTKLLGEEYQTLLNEKFNQGVIDYLPNENKQTGAYSTGFYGCPSIVLMNYVNDYSSVSTLAHEIGHAMHSEFSDRAQPLPLSNYVIFVAEVASTVNEILLNLHTSKTADKDEKIALAFELLDSVRSTIFRQTLFSEFEDFTHAELEAGKPLTYEDYNKKYYELNKKYYGENVKLPDELKYEWARIPHFYRPFYVYKYATGFVSALCIVQNLLADQQYYSKYINFLKSGCTKSPVELLQDIGVDLTTDEPYIKAFEFVNNIIGQIN